MREEMTAIKDRFILDITMNLSSDFPGWPGDAPGQIERTSSISQGELYNSSSIRSSLHWGTHIDAPFHLYEDRWTVDQIPLDILMGKVQVLEIPEVKKINAQTLEKYSIKSDTRVLLKTRNSDFWKQSFTFREDFSALTEDAADYLVKLGIKLVGIDYFSLDLYDAVDLPVHQILYQHNIVGIELLDLRQVKSGYYDLICLPMKIKRGDGAPARVVLVK
jgi:arylformamidase